MNQKIVPFGLLAFLVLVGVSLAGAPPEEASSSVGCHGAVSSSRGASKAASGCHGASEASGCHGEKAEKAKKASCHGRYTLTQRVADRHEARKEARAERRDVRAESRASKASCHGAKAKPAKATCHGVQAESDCECESDCDCG